jgi:hypothetical protein
MTLLHFSEDPNLTVFHPRITAGKDDTPAVVWAIDEQYAFLYYFPRDCPRVVYWSLPDSSEADKERFFGHTAARAIVVVEGEWLERIVDCRLFVYRLPSDHFLPVVSPDAPGYHGAFTSHETVYPLSVEPVGDLLRAHRDAVIEVRVTPSFWPLWDPLVASTLHFSGIRLRNAVPRRQLDAP